MKSKTMNFGDIDHVAIVVNSLKSSISFYEKVMGFKTERAFGNRELGIKAVVLKRKNSRIELFEYKNTSPAFAKRKRVIHGMKVPKSYFEPGIRHIAFRTGKFNKAVLGLQERGVTPKVPPKTGYSGDSITFFSDPNGVLLELVSPVAKKTAKKIAKKIDRKQRPKQAGNQ